MTLHIHEVQAADLPAMHSILVICGEHMYRMEGLKHWYPYRSFVLYEQETTYANVYAVYQGDFLVGTFHLKAKARPYYRPDQWHDPQATALYLGGFGILPHVQGQGLGKRAMNAIDDIVQQGGYQALRFDGVSSNKKLLNFYDKLGYVRRGIAAPAIDGAMPVMCFERTF